MKSQHLKDMQTEPKLTYLFQIAIMHIEQFCRAYYLLIVAAALLYSEKIIIGYNLPEGLATKVIHCVSHGRIPCYDSLEFEFTLIRCKFSVWFMIIV